MNRAAREVREETAAAWAARLADATPLTLAERAALAAWTAADPANQARLETYRALWGDGAFAAALATPGRRPSRRQVLAGGALAAGLAGIGWLGRAPLGRALADAATAPGEITTLPPLPGGARLTLDTASAVDIAEDGTLQLRAGALRVAVPANAPPVTVQGTRMLVLAGAGCQMTLRAEAAAEHLAVLAGGATASAAATVRMVAAGEGLVCDAGGLGPVHALSPGERAMAEGFSEAWRRFDGATLAEVAAEIARYQSQPLLVADQVAALQVTGRFRLADPRAALAALEAGLPVKLRRYGPILRLEEKI